TMAKPKPNITPVTTRSLVSIRRFAPALTIASAGSPCRRRKSVRSKPGSAPSWRCYSLTDCRWGLEAVVRRRRGQRPLEALRAFPHLVGRLRAAFHTLYYRVNEEEL